MSDDVAALAEVLDGHVRCTWLYDGEDVTWSCGLVAKDYEPHLKAALLASPAHQAIVAAAEQRGRVAALDEARDALYRGEGPGTTPDSDIAYGEWLGNRS